MAAPQNVVGDRLDRLVVGQLVHLSPPVLTEATPDDGWLTVAGVVLAGDQVTVTFDDDTTFTGPANRLVRIGW